MSEYMFSVTKRRLPMRVANRRDRICQKHGGYGYTQINQADGTWLGWFSGPNRGEPFDTSLANRVLDECGVPDDYEDE